MPNAILTPEVRAVLEKATIDGVSNRVTLNQPNLPRDLYVAVNKVLVNAGGKWSRKFQSHLFPGDRKWR